MILATARGDREVRGLFDGIDRVPNPASFGGTTTYSGARVDLGRAASVAVVFRAYRLVAETIAGFPLGVTKGREMNAPVVDVPQSALLQQPIMGHPAFHTWAYIVGSLMRGNAYLLKMKDRTGRVVELHPLNPDRVRVKFDAGRKEFHVRDGGKVTILSPREILHIPGILLEDPCVGVSVIAAARHGVGNALARQEFEGRFLAHDATPPTVLVHPGTPDRTQREELRESWNARHAGAQNAGRVGLLWGGIEAKQLGVSMEDAQFIESQRFTVQEVARWFGLPSGALGDPDAPGADDPEKENMRLLQFGVKPWIDMAESGLHADDDVFPDKSLYPNFKTADLLRPNLVRLLEAAHRARQAGIATANEFGRPQLGLPPHPDGDELQATPVGGAPNADTPQEPEVEEPRSVAVNFSEGAFQFRQGDTRVEPAKVEFHEGAIQTQTRYSKGAFSPEVTVPVDARSEHKHEHTHESPTINNRVDVKPAEVRIPPPKPTVKRIMEDRDGRIIGVREEPAE